MYFLRSLQSSDKSQCVVPNLYGHHMSQQCFYHGLWYCIMSTRIYKTISVNHWKEKLDYCVIFFPLDYWLRRILVGVGNGIPNAREVDHSQQVCEWDGCVCIWAHHVNVDTLIDTWSSQWFVVTMIYRDDFFYIRIKKDGGQAGEKCLLRGYFSCFFFDVFGVNSGEDTTSRTNWHHNHVIHGRGEVGQMEGGTDTGDSGNQVIGNWHDWLGLDLNGPNTGSGVAKNLR